MLFLVPLGFKSLVVCAVLVNYHFPGSFAGEKMKIKVVGKNVHATIPKGNMGYDHCSWHCSCRTYFCCLVLALANTRPWPFVSFFQTALKNSEFKTTHNTIGIVAYTVSDNLLRNSGIHTAECQCDFLLPHTLLEWALEKAPHLKRENLISTVVKERINTTNKNI